MSRRFDVAKRLSGREALIRELIDFKVDVTKRGKAVLENGGEKLVHDAKSLPLFQQFARGDPPRCDDVSLRNRPNPPDASKDNANGADEAGLFNVHCAVDN